MAQIIPFPTVQERKLAEAFAAAMIRSGMTIKGGKQVLIKRLVREK